MRHPYEGEPLSIATLPGMAERTITLDGFSKTFAMTGWRLGYGIVPEWLGPSFSRLVINSVSCTNAFAQLGAVEALTGPQDAADAMGEEFIARRQLMVEGLNAIPGVTCVMPHGAFYAFPNVSSFGRTSNEIADHLLYDAGVCGLSGTAFGVRGEGHLRFSYANSRENLASRARPHRRLAFQARTDRGARSAPHDGSAPRARHPDHPRRGARRGSRGRRGRPLGRTSCRRRGTSCSGGRRARTALLTLLTDRVDDELLDAAGPQLKVVSNFAVGFDNIDVPACTRRGIPVGNTPGVLTETTADLAFALLMAAARRIPEGDRLRPRRPLADLGADAAAGRRRPRRDAGDRRLRADRPGDGSPRPRASG